MIEWNGSGVEKRPARKSIRAVSCSVPCPDEGKADDVAFWNYFQYGIDFLVTPEGLVSKIIIHSNIVCPPHL
jgi:hypothetical protein